MEIFMYLLLAIAFGGLAFMLPFIFKRDTYFLSISIYLLLMTALIFWINFLSEIL